MELLPPFISQTLRDGTPQVQIKSNLSAGSETYFIGYNCYHLVYDTVKGPQEHKFHIKYLNWWK